MHSWIERLHADSAEFSPALTAVKVGVALAIGLLIGFERQWSHKDAGVRAFCFAALLGALTAMVSQPLMITAMAGVILIAALMTVQDILKGRAFEGATSYGLILTFVLGVLCGFGHIFTATASAIVTTWLLSLKLEFRAFAGNVSHEEIRSALLLGLFGLVIWPLLPDRYVDPWQLVEPREAWLTVMVIASLGFVNYILLRVYGTRGVSLAAILGGLVNSTAAAAELVTTLPAAGLIPQTVAAVLLTSCAMFGRNLLLLGIFARESAPYACAPLLAMTLVAAYFAWRNTRPTDEERDMQLKLSSPVSVKKVLHFGVIFLIIQIGAILARRFLGPSGLLLVSILGGTVSSASTTAAAATLAAHGGATALHAATAVIATSIVSTTMNYIMVLRSSKEPRITRGVGIATGLQAAVGIIAAVLEMRIFR
jgi:uncharacterized membrane protein (DUF4010 family)